jgi:hypothetical protein
MTGKERHAGIVMVKPHAFEQVLAPVVADILDGGETAKRLSTDDPLRSFLGRIETRAPVIRDLRSCNVGTSLLNVFYEDKRERRYFPLILERYVGRVAFLPYIFHGNTEELPQLYDAMKGSAETFDTKGHAVSQATGVRGLLSEPYLAVDSSALLLDDTAYRERCSPMIDNVFHVCDTQQQNEQALQLLGLEEVLQGNRLQVTDIARL